MRINRKKIDELVRRGDLQCAEQEIIRYDDIGVPKEYSGLTAYFQSKTTLVLISKYIDEMVSISSEVFELILLRLHSLVEVQMAKSPSDRELRHLNAQAIPLIMTGLLKKGCGEQLEVLYSKLATLASAYRDDAEMRVQFAKGTANLIGACSRIDMLPLAAGALGKIWITFKQSEENPDLAIEVTACIYNYIHQSCAFGRIINPLIWIRRLQSVASKYVVHEEIAVFAARALAKIIEAAADRGRIDIVNELLLRLRALSQRGSDQEGVSRELARGHFHLLTILSKNNNFDAIEEEVSIIRDLNTLHPESIDLRRILMNSLYNAYFAFLPVHDVEKAYAHAEELFCIYKQYRLDKKISEVFDLAMGQLFRSLTDKGRIAEIETLAKLIDPVNYS